MNRNGKLNSRRVNTSSHAHMSSNPAPTSAMTGFGKAVSPSQAPTAQPVAPGKGFVPATKGSIPAGLAAYLAARKKK